MAGDKSSGFWGKRVGVVGCKLGVEELVLMMARTVVNWGGARAGVAGDKSSGLWGKTCRRGGM